MPQEKDVFDDIEGLIVEEARAIYSKTVIEHFMNPQNIGPMEDADCSTFMTGMCGDTIGIYVKLDDNRRIGTISFITNGCGPTIACGSALTCMARGLPVDDARNISSSALIEFLDGLPRENTHCADLAVNTLHGALAKVENLE
jgi:nitrogen fixation NifU-like protein